MRSKLKHKLFLHVGLHKTGSSFLQKKVFPLIPNSYLLTRPVTQLNHHLNKLQYADDSFYVREETFSFFSGIGSDTLILSDEAFEGNPIGWNCINRSIIARRFSDLFENVHVILFIRNQFDLIESLYRQFLRAHTFGFSTLDEFVHYSKSSYTLKDYEDKRPGSKGFLQHDSTKFFFHPHTLLYSNLIQLYKGLFKDVSVFLFEDLVYRPTDIQKRFESLFNTKLSGVFSDVEPVNSSLDSRTLFRYKVQKRLRMICPADNIFFGRFCSFISHLLPGKVDSDVSSLSELKQLYLIDNWSVNEKWPDIGLSRYKDQYLV